MAISKKKGASIKDIAKEAGVSTSLVSFVLNGKQKQYRVNDQVADRIKEIAQRLDYKPNGFAKSLRDGTSHTIGVIVSDISNQFFAEIVRNIETTAEQYGYMALFASSDENASKASDLASKMLSKEVDGMILVPCEGSSDIIKMLTERNVPLVLLDRYIPDIHTDYVCLNNKQSGYEATSHLIKQGYKKISMISYGIDLTNMKERQEGYKAAMTDAGLKENICIKFVDVEINSLKKSCDKAMDALTDNGTEAIVFATNSIALTCLYYIQKKGIRIPDELGLVCFDGETAFDLFYAPLTYIKQPLERMAKKAVEILIEHIEAKDSLTQQVEAGGTLVERASSKRRGKIN